MDGGVAERRSCMSEWGVGITGKNMVLFHNNVSYIMYHITFLHVLICP